MSGIFEMAWEKGAAPESQASGAVIFPCFQKFESVPAPQHVAVSILSFQWI